MSLSKYIYANNCINCHLPSIDLRGGLCENCFSLFSIELKKRNDLYYFINYKENKSYFLYQAKQFNRPYYIKKFSSYCGSLFSSLSPPEGILTYVPIHKNDMARRGYNQSEIIAAEFGKNTHFKVMKLLKKIRITEKQKNLNLNLRMSNLEGAFSSIKKKINYPLVYLIDDICTTGSTLNECKKVLLASGVEKVVFIALAYVKVK
ncbi:MAG: ComF family protein [Clostridia bacterium]|nr:ComF family protein [Clostridia bacterium]